MPESRSSATVTFLFTDIEGSTRRWEVQREAMSAALARHDALVRAAIEAHGGRVFKTVGDAFCAAFEWAPAALEAALTAQRAIGGEDWSAFGLDGDALRIRAAIHTGLAEARDDDFFGPAVNRVARLLAAGHGGQVLVSRVTEELAQHHVPAGIILRSLGEHRLKDLDRPEDIYQLEGDGLDAAFPPLRTLDAVPGNLPVQLTSFVGRERELHVLKQLVADNRLVTLTGIGGTGKTRLAIHAAAELCEDFALGAWFVDLAPVSDGSLVTATVAATLGLSTDQGQSVDAALGSHIGSKRMLIVLDNCEHLVASTAALADRLLRTAPNLRLIATSREALSIAGEAILAVPTLSSPAPGSIAATADAVAALSQFDAVRLFVDRAVAVKREFAITPDIAPALAGICHQLDGIPLAIELAAARVRVMSVVDIHHRLADRFRLLTGGSRVAPDRQQTLLATIQWSHELLDPSEQAMFRRLSVFQGGWTMASAECICGDADASDVDVIELLARLVDKSLVAAGETLGRSRYRFLESIQQFARGRLEAAGELEELLGRHTAYFVAEATLATERFESGKTESLSWCERENDNLRAVIDRLTAEPRTVDDAARLVIQLYQHWAQHARQTEGHMHGTSLLAARDFGTTPERALLRYIVAALGIELGRRTGAVAALELALEDFLAFGDARHASWCLNDLGIQLMFQGRYAEARAHFARSLDLKRDSAPIWDIAITASNVAELDWHFGDFDGARAGWMEAEQLLDGRGGAVATPHVVLADVKRGLGHLARREGDLEFALSHYLRGLEVALASQSPIFIVRLLIAIAVIAADRGDCATAASLHGAARACSDAHAVYLEQMDLDALDPTAIAGRLALGDAAWDAAVAAGKLLSIEEAVTVAMAVSPGATP